MKRPVEAMSPVELVALAAMGSPLDSGWLDTTEPPASDAFDELPQRAAAAEAPALQTLTTLRYADIVTRLVVERAFFAELADILEEADARIDRGLLVDLDVVAMQIASRIRPNLTTATFVRVTG